MSIFSYLKTHSVLATTLVLVAIAASIITGRVAGSKSTTTNTGTNIKHVTLVDIDSFRADSSRIAVDGVVESVSQVDLKSQISAPLSNLMVGLGDSVIAGDIIAELSNADIRAQLDQAKASLSLEDVSVESTRRAAIDAMTDAYIKADDAVRTNIDPMFLNNTGTSPQLSTYIVDKNLYNEIKALRSDLDPIFVSWKTAIGNLSEKSTDEFLQSTLASTQRNISIIRTLLNKISQGLNYTATIALPSDLVIINAWKTTISTQRAYMSAVDTSITASTKALSSALITSGSNTSSSSVANAGVRNLEAALAKTIIRAPISGKIAALPLRVGELASPGQLIATIVGPGGLEIDAYASGEDIDKINKGAIATINGKATGIVVNVAPSVNQTNKKLQVKILLDNPDNSGLVIGENVSAYIQGSLLSQALSDVTPYRLPIQNVKIVPGNAYIFTVDQNSKIVKHSVLINKVDGDYIEITGDVRPGMKIATPVYELEEGQVVTTE